MRRLYAARGYTLIEIMMVVAIGLTLMSFATVNIGRALKSARGDGALYTVMSQLRNARQMAISQGRPMIFGIASPNQVVSWRLDSGRPRYPDQRPEQRY
jgi:prepilin-type N-terminal cleavage/methylation domain-containing protein